MTVESLMRKADRACRSARALLELGDTDGACNRACYAVFDAARAAVHDSGAETEGLQVGRTHRGVLTAFNEQMIKNG